MNPHRAFLAGEPGSGKTTAIKKVCGELAKRGLRVGGIISGEDRSGGVRVGFMLEDLATHQTGILAHVNQSGGPRVGKYGVNIQDLESIGAKAIRKAVEEADVIIVDEIGPMELKSQAFIAAVEEALRTSKPFIGTIHRHASHPLLERIKSDPATGIIELTQANRESLPKLLLEQVTATIGS